MYAGRFIIERDFNVEEMWEKGVLESYSNALESKVNNFCETLDTIEKQLMEYKMFREKVYKIPDHEQIRWCVEICNALQDFYGWGSVSLTELEQTLRGLSFRARSWVAKQIRRCIDWLVNKMIPFFKNFAPPLKVLGWSIGGSGGVPAGLSISISITFKP